MKRFPFLAALITLFVLPNVLAQEKTKHVDAKEAGKLVREGKVTVLDVRTEDEFKEGHIKGAKNVDFNSDTFAKQAAEMDKSKPILVHCQGGGRSTKALPALEKLEFEIYHLDGGMTAWEEAGQPVVK